MIYNYTKLLMCTLYTISFFGNECLELIFLVFPDRHEAPQHAAGDDGNHTAVDPAQIADEAALSQLGVPDLAVKCLHGPRRLAGPWPQPWR